MTDTSRRTIRRSKTATVFETGKHRRIIAGLGPGDYVSFRLEGTKRWTDPLSLVNLFHMALRATVNRTIADENKQRKAQGRRLLKKKPMTVW